jgi:transposase-like protein/IS1 family transposase
MTCHYCRIQCKRFGKHRNGLQRYRCNQCRKTYTEEHERLLDEMRLPFDKACAILQLLLEGMSVRSAERLTRVHRDTILRLLILAGERCQRLMDERLTGLNVRDVEVDEIWGYVGKKEARKTPLEESAAEIGDAYCYVALERHSKLVLCHYLGKRNVPSTEHFIAKLAHVTSTFPYQLTSDGFGPYKNAAKKYLARRVHFAQLIKVYSSPREGEQRYSAGEVVEAVPVAIMGDPRPARICTSHVERGNLSIRMGMRRMTRLTNAFSKKWENLEAAYSLWFAYYNFCRAHQALRVTPAMQAGITDSAWPISQLLSVQ